MRNWPSPNQAQRALPPAGYSLKSRNWSCPWIRCRCLCLSSCVHHWPIRTFPARIVFSFLPLDIPVRTPPPMKSPTSCSATSIRSSSASLHSTTASQAGAHRRRCPSVTADKARASEEAPHPEIETVRGIDAICARGHRRSIRPFEEPPILGLTLERVELCPGSVPESRPAFRLPLSTRQPWVAVARCLGHHRAASRHQGARSEVARFPSGVPKSPERCMAKRLGSVTKLHSRSTGPAAM